MIEQNNIIENLETETLCDLKHDKKGPMKRMREDGSNSEKEEEEEAEWEWHVVKKSGKKEKKTHKDEVEVDIFSK